MRVRQARANHILTLLVFAVTLAVTATGTLGQGRRELRVGVPGLPATLDPATALEGTVPLIARQVFDTLVAYREGSTDVEPALATRWSMSRDGLVWAFELREGVRFHDGAPLTVPDVVASFERHRTGDSVVWPALLRGSPGVVREVRAAGARTVQFLLLQPYAPLLTVLAHPGLAVIRPGDGGRLVGTGPFRLADAGAGRLALESVATSWGGPPRVDRIVFVNVETDDQAERDLAARALDLWFPAGAPRRTAGAVSVPGLRVGLLAFQTEKEPFSRKKVRRAVAAALDPATLNAALGDAAVALSAFLPPAVWARREGPPILGGSKDAARAHLADGGWPKGAAPTLLVPADTAPVDLPHLAAAVQTLLAEAGMSVVSRLEPPDAARGALQAGEHDLAIVETSAVGGDPHLLLYPLSTSEGAQRGPRVRNFSFYRNPRLDDVLIRASQLSFRPERARLYQRAQALLAEEMPWVPLYVRLIWAAARPEVRGLRLHPTGFHRLAPVSVEGGPSQIP
ncbi:MAG: ABC transporter substrate-binding protein [Candidatus Rokuibacteriota bacterium]